MGEKEGRDVPRRRFLVQLAAGTGLLAGGLSACSAVATFQARLVKGRIIAAHAELEEIFRVDHVALVTAAGLPEAIILIRMDEDSYRALGARCTHLGCQVRPGKHSLRCPCHGAVFDLEGNVVRGPARKPLPRYELEVKETTLEIVVPQNEKGWQICCGLVE